MVELLLEAATKKRGRPPLYSQEYYENMHLLYPDISKRGITNISYVVTGYDIAEKLLGEKAEPTFMHKGKGFLMQGVLEQVGRMSKQDGYSTQDCISILEIALHLHDERGWTSRQMERFIRRVRITGEI